MGKLTIKERESLNKLLTLSKKVREEHGLPITYPEMAVAFGISVATVKYYQKHLKIPEVVKEEEYDSEAWLRDRSRVADEALLGACEKGNANALRTYYQLTKRLVEKQEVTHSFNASDILKAINQARAEFDAGRDAQQGEGVGKVSDGLSPLPENLRLSSGQGSAEDSSV